MLITTKQLSPMSTTRSLPHLICLLLIGCLSTCVDHNNLTPTPGSTAVRQRVRSLTLDNPNNTSTVSLFQYNAQGRISQLVTYQTPDSTVAPVELTTYQYDGQNRLSQVRRVFARRAPTNLISTTELYTLSYDGSGRLMGIGYANGFSVGFTYDNNGQLISSGRSFTTGGLNLRGSDQFTFMGNNLTALSSTRTIPTRGGPDLTSLVNYTFTHDDKLNPFYGLFIIPAPYPNGFVNLTFGGGTVTTYFGGVDNVLTLSRNNVLTSQAMAAANQTALTQYAYVYNAANLPVRRTTTVGGAVTETLRFDYESY